MATAAYCVDPAFGDPTGTEVARAQALTCGVCVGDASGGLITAYPSVVVSSALGSVAPVVIPDNIGQATLAAVQAAMTTAETAENAAQATVASALTSLQGLAAELDPWLTQATADNTALAGMTGNTLAPIVSRLLVATATIAEALAFLAMVQRVIPLATLPAIP